MAGGRLVGIAVRERSRAPMKELERGRIELGRGLEGDSRGTSRGRNVTVLSREGWERACAEVCAENDARPPWTTRRANLLVEGLPSWVDSKGARLRVGSVTLEIQGECDPCARMDQQLSGLRRALEPEWRAGVECTVLEPGEVALGDRVELEPA